MTATASITRPAPKVAKKGRMVVLRMSSESLAKFEPTASSVPSSKKLSATSMKEDTAPTTAPSEAAVDKSPDANAKSVPLATTATTDNSNSNSNNNNDDEDNNSKNNNNNHNNEAVDNTGNENDASSSPAKTGPGKKRGGAAVAGRKRAPPSIDPNAPPRERGRPGPKKKLRLPDGSIDRTGEKNATGANGTMPAHKLGPKANTGAINAGLRALDRTGKPCRKWGKKELNLKSFTGTMWSMSSWGAPPRDAFSGDVKSDSTASSEVKAIHESSAVPSDRSHSQIDGDTTMVNGIESSPARAIAA